MQFSAAQIAILVNGKVEGDESVTVSGFGKIENATNGEISFLNNRKYEDFIYNTDASIVLINEDLSLRQRVKPTLIRVKDAYTALAILLNKYEQLKQDARTGIQQPAYIDNTARYGENVFIAAFCYIGRNVIIGNNTRIQAGVFIGDNARIGNDCRIDAGVKIYHDCTIGDHVRILAGTVIGSDGFGFAPQPDGSFVKIPQMGNVVIEDHVDIGANVTIDRATLGSTIIRSGVKLDNLIQVAHNVEVGSNTVIAAQAGISGSTKIGKGVMIGGQAGIVGHIHLGDGSKVNAQSGVSKSLEPGQAVTGSPAFDYTAALRSQAVLRKLPELEKRIKELENQLKAFKDAE
jgi:UDP-3-O-[3-hydroxymyristoyl] glucosamine N-acyltransferase